MATFPPASRQVATGRSVYCRSVYCRWGWCLSVVAIAAMLIGIAASDAEAAKRRRRHSRSRRALVAAQAQKSRAIKSIQRQVASARKVLTSARSQVSMSQSQVSKSMAELTRIRVDIEAAHDDVQEASKALREIEAEILAEQSSDSEFSRAKTAFDESEQETHRVIHHLLDLPDAIGSSESPAGLSDIVKLSAEQRNTLDSDARYQSAQQKLSSAGSRLRDLRNKLFAADSQWIVAQREWFDARNRSRKETDKARSVGYGSRKGKQQLTNAQRIAAESQRVIALGEARLRQLGASRSPSKTSKNQSRTSGKRRTR